MSDYTFLEILQIFAIPLIVILSPPIYIAIKTRQKNNTVSLHRNSKFKWGIYWFFIALLLFSVLMYLTGGVGLYFRLEKGLYIDDRQISWNLTTRLSIIIPFNPGLGLFVISVLGGLLYASIIALPKHCAVPKVVSVSNLDVNPTNQSIEELTASSKLSSTMSSITSTGSALSSVPVCCSTSLVAVILPTSTALLAPIAPILLIGSMGLMLFQIKSNVFPRFGI